MNEQLEPVPPVNPGPTVGGQLTGLLWLLGVPAAQRTSCRDQRTQRREWNR